MVRAPFFDENGVKKGAWSHEEDEKLRSYIQRYGLWNWRELPKFAGLKRCGKSCRLRWVNYLQPNVKRGNYTKEEERLIGKLHEEFGKKWSLIAAQLPGRTDNEIKNYWHTHMKNRGKKTRKADYEKANETSEHEDNQSTKAETKNILATIIPSYQILESSPLSPETSCLSSSSNSANVSGTKCASEEIINSFESFPQCSGDFWTEPFVSDNSYFPNEYQSTYLSPFFSYNTDSMDLFYQVMQELSENNAY